MVTDIPTNNFIRCLDLVCRNSKEKIEEVVSHLRCFDFSVASGYTRTQLLFRAFM